MNTPARRPAGADLLRELTGELGPRALHRGHMSVTARLRRPVRG